MTDELRWYLLEKKRIEARILRAFRYLRRSGIEPILIKGWAAARNYPPDVPRFSLDIDLAVSSSDHSTVEALVATGNADLPGVDLHRELKDLDTCPWTDLITRSELVDLDDEQIRLLAPEDHLRVLCSHWLINGGVSPERLMDVVYAVRNRPASFDWDVCLNSVSANRRGWIIATIGLAHRYMHLEIDGLPFAKEARALPGWLTEFVEKEWKTDVVLWPLDGSVGNVRHFLRQVRKRIPPNPIQATVNCEGPFDDRPRWTYQLRDAIHRLRPSARRVLPALKKRME